MTYDQMARTPMHRWWRPVLGTVVVAAGYLLVSLIVLLGGMLFAVMAGVEISMTGAIPFADPVLGLAVMLLSIAAALPVVFGAAWLIQRRPPGTLSSVLGRLRWGWMLLCVPVALGAGVLGHLTASIVFGLTGGEMPAGIGWAGWDTFISGLAVTLILVPIQAASEEYLFRGWLIQAFGAFLRTPWPGIVLGSAGFAALHRYTGWGIVDVFAFGVVAGWLAVRTGGLEAPIALHVVNNVLGLGISSASGDLEGALEQGAVAWQALASSAVQLTVFVVVVLLLARRRGVETTTPGREVSPPLPINT
ncbi:type II CAAX prenyl endopeptidase Rce1 family protein [Spongiactinospora sp. 9N601]|uniref:CPBP family intramembrane glutamic endopeptidase n=1 Tax=Spongiactinospora sp. 9N601 TaxID=3375149 RepID=UPI0037B32349